MKIHNDKHAQTGSFLDDSVQVLEIHIRKVLGTVHDVTEAPVSYRDTNCVQSGIMNALNIIRSDPTSIVIIEVGICLRLAQATDTVKLGALPRATHR